MNSPYFDITGPSANLRETGSRDGRRPAGRVRYRSTWLVLQPDDEALGVLPQVSLQGATSWRSLRLPGHGAKQQRAALFARVFRGL
jgi:hypothetical protein